MASSLSSQATAAAATAAATATAGNGTTAAVADNNGVEVTFLGTGSAFCDYRINYHNNAMVKTEAGYVLLDCGNTALQSLKELSLTPHDVAGVIVTHLHGDHCGGLEQMVWERLYTGPSGPSFRTTPVFGPADLYFGLKKYLSPCIDEYMWSDKETYSGGFDRLVEFTHVRQLPLPGAAKMAEDGSRPVKRRKENAKRVPAYGGKWAVGEEAGPNVLRAPVDEVTVGGVTFRIYPTPHVECPKNDVHKPAYSISVHTGEKTHFVYSGDTVYRSDIGELFPGDYPIFHDCTFAPVYPGTVHTHYVELLQLDQQTRKRIRLMHYNVVPENVDPIADGFGAVATRHGKYVL